MVGLHGCSLAAGWRVPCSHKDQGGAALFQLIQTKLKLSHKEECLQRCSWRRSSTLTLVGCCARLAAWRTLISAYSVLFAHTKGFHHTLVSKRCANMLFISSPDCLVYWQRGDKFLLAGIYFSLSRITSNLRDTCFTCSYTRSTKKERAIFFSASVILLHLSLHVASAELSSNPKMFFLPDGITLIHCCSIPVK